MKYEVMSMNQEVDPSVVNGTCIGQDNGCVSFNGVCGSIDNACSSSDAFCNFDYMCSIPGHYHYCDYSLPL